MSILNLCDQPVASVSLGATCADAINVMLERRVGAVCVVDGDGRPAGIFTERDVLRKLALSGLDPKAVMVRDYMTSSLDLATLKTTPGEAFAAMIHTHYRHLPVVNEQGVLMGILSIRNLLQSKIDELTQQLDSIEIAMSNDAPGGD
ncbi:MAG TPA: CBS domain-containing protein [Terriglobales bacterium]|nr:CBS domain-containing protein [Terriglobales bacterium]